MKFLKYIVAILLVLAIVAGALHIYRETIVLRIANSVLDGTGITVTELSIESLRTDFVELSYLELLQEDETRLELSGLAVPLELPNSIGNDISIETVVLVPAAPDGAPPSPVAALRAFLSLPESVPNAYVRVARVEVPQTPPLSDLTWRLQAGRQELAFVFEALEVRLHVDSAAAETHVATLSADAGDTADALALTSSIRPDETGYAIEGETSIVLMPWLPVLQQAGLKLEGLDSVTARLEGPISAQLYDDRPQTASVSAQLSLAGKLSALYGMPDGTHVSVEADTQAPVQLSSGYPDLDWQARLRQLDLVVELDGVDGFPLQATDIECRAGISCSAALGLDIGPLQFGPATIGNVKLRASLDVERDSITTMVIAPDLSLQMTALDAAPISAASVTSTAFSGARFVLGDAAWRGDIGHLGLLFEGITDGEGLAATVPLSFSSIEVRDNGARVNADLALQSQAEALVWNDLPIVMPGVSGHIERDANHVSASATITDDLGGLSADVDAAFDLSSGSGTISVPEARLDFELRKLSTLLATWPYDWDVLSGTWTANADLEWHRTDEGLQYRGSASQNAHSLAGSYGDIAFAGLSTSLTTAIDAASGVAVSPATLVLDIVDFGIPVQNLSADYALDVADQSVAVENLTMSILGGRITADPFRAGLNEESIALVLRPRSIQLKFILDLANFRNIEMSGSISGAIPVSIQGKNITIADGRLQSDPPGGVIRYRPGDSTGDSTLDVVSQALSNFQFDSLTSDISYTVDGDLKQQMRLTGINPDMDERQPVILNLGVENNIPSMLRSLQATRTIEDIIERKTQN